MSVVVCKRHRQDTVRGGQVPADPLQTDHPALGRVDAGQPVVSQWRHTVGMVLSEHPVWLQAEAASDADEGCGGCAPGAGALPCQDQPLTRCDAPVLAGEAVRLATALQALRRVADAEGNLVDTRRITALRASADEVDLTLSFPRRCGPSRLLAEDAFQVLRRALPDTDVYVHHAA